MVGKGKASGRSYANMMKIKRKLSAMKTAKNTELFLKLYVKNTWQKEKNAHHIATEVDA